MKLYNTLTRSLEEFAPLAPPAVTMYVCGPTVYDDPHIGHARSAYIFDVLRRYLTYKKYAVKFVRNVTDVDDKIIDKARQELATSDKRQATSDLNAACREVAERYLRRYHEAMDRLGIGRPDVEPKATEHVVPVMTDLIAKLFLQGVAYEAKDGVYFAVRKHPGYGKLSNRTLDDLKAGARVEPGEGKQDPMDFALWKAAKLGEPSWKSPWGEGRPGWHIECSAMSTKYLGDTFDIHGGGVDLVFPHHENEVAQAEAAGKPFAKCWVHNGLLTVNGEKMSKSLGNFVTVQEALEGAGGGRRGTGENEPAADILKTFFLGSHYRSPVDYTKANLQTARARYERWLHFLRKSDQWRSRAILPDRPLEKWMKMKGDFESAMDDDLNTPRALAVLDQLVTQSDKLGLTAYAFTATDPQRTLIALGEIVAAADLLLELGRTIGLFIAYRSVTFTDELLRLIRERDDARNQKDFQTADRIRQELGQKGVLVEDTDQGPIVIPK